MILIDTSVWIDHLNGHASVEAAQLTTLIEEQQRIVVPGIVLTEILAGLRSEADVERIADLFTAFDLAPDLEEADYAEAARIYRVCRARGVTIRSTIDCLIAQMCLRRGYFLLARDRHFDAIARHFPLKRVGVQLRVHDRARAG